MKVTSDVPHTITRYRTVAEFILAGLFFTACLIIISLSRFSLPISVVVQAKVPSNDVYQLFYDRGYGFNENDVVRVPVRRSDDFQNVQFNLPSGHTSAIRSFRFAVGNRPGLIQIRSILLKSFLKKHQWNARGISNNFSAMNAIDMFEVKKDVLFLHSNGVGPFFDSRIDLSSIVRDGLLRKNTLRLKLILVCLALGASLILFSMSRLFNVTERALGSLNLSEVPHILLIALFLLTLSLPLIQNTFDFFPAARSSEKRRLAEKPDLKLGTLANFPKNFEAYFNDTFGFRNVLIRLKSIMYLKIFKISPVPAVVVGKDGWLFLNEGIDDYTGTAPFSNEQLDKIGANIDRMNTWLASRGILFLIVIAPDKHSIYPEFLPDTIRKERPQSQQDQLIEYLGKKAAHFQIVDLREPLRRAKSLFPVYYMTDTHWNIYGGYIVYREIMHRLSSHFSDLKPISVEPQDIILGKNSVIRASDDKYGDLAEMLSLGGMLSDVTVRYGGDIPIILSTRHRKAVIFHDSFLGEPLFDLLSLHFKIINREHERGKFEYELIEKEKPDVVMLEIVERFKDTLLNANMPNEKKTRRYNKHEGHG